MKQIKLKLKHNPIYYSPIGSGPESLFILAMFFCVEMRGSTINFFYEWMLNSNPILNRSSINITTLEKINNNMYMYLNYDMESYYSDPEKYSITIALDQLIKLTNQWDELLGIMSPFIIIKQEDDRFEMIKSQE